MAVIGKYWRHEFLVGSPPIVVWLRRVDVFEFMDEMGAEKVAPVEGVKVDGFRQRSAQMIGFIEDVTGVEIVAPDNSKSALAWPADKDAILSEIQAAPLQYAALVKAFAEHYYGTDLGESAPLPVSA